MSTVAWNDLKLDLELDLDCDNFNPHNTTFHTELCFSNLTESVLLVGGAKCKVNPGRAPPARITSLSLMLISNIVVRASN